MAWITLQDARAARVGSTSVEDAKKSLFAKKDIKAQVEVDIDNVCRREKAGFCRAAISPSSDRKRFSRRSERASIDGLMFCSVQP